MQSDKNETNKELHRVARDHSIGNRIRKAEDARSNETLQVQRHKEYEERIGKLLNPELEIVENEAS